MSDPEKLPRYTLGVEARFAQQGKAQLSACMEAAADGIEVILVWRLQRMCTPAPIEHADELCAPYASVIDLNRAELPFPAQLRTWSSEDYVSVAEHEPGNPRFNPSVRKSLHVGFKAAAKIGTRFLNAFEGNEAVVSRPVKRNLFQSTFAPFSRVANPGKGTSHDESSCTHGPGAGAGCGHA